MIDESIPLATLLAQGLASRPELDVQQALTQAAQNRVQQEKWRPFIPNVPCPSRVSTQANRSRARTRQSS
jgi:hypothetical protein